MDKKYLVWDWSDGRTVTPVDHADANGGGRQVVILTTKEDACQLAHEVYREERIPQLVIELSLDGEAKAVLFVGHLDGDHVREYGAMYSRVRAEIERATTAAIVQFLCNTLAREA